MSNSGMRGEHSGTAERSLSANPHNGYPGQNSVPGTALQGASGRDPEELLRKIGVWATRRMLRRSSRERIWTKHKRSSWGAVKEGDFTYDSGSAPSMKSGNCHFARAPRCPVESTIGDGMKIKYLVATGVRNDPNLEPSPSRLGTRREGLPRAQCDCRSLGHVTLYESQGTGSAVVCVRWNSPACICRCDRVTLFTTPKGGHHPEPGDQAQALIRRQTASSPSRRCRPSSTAPADWCCR